MLNGMGVTSRLIPIFALVLVATLVLPSPYAISSLSVKPQSSLNNDPSLQNTINSASNFIKNGMSVIPYAYAAPAIAINPTSGPTGATITITGSGFTPNTQYIEVYFDTIGDAVQYYPNVTFTSDSSGNVPPGTTFTIPAIIPLLNDPTPCGSGTFYAADATNGQPVAGAPFTVTACSSPTPSLSVIPATGSGKVSFATDTGGFTSITAVSQSSLTPSPPAGSYPYGFFNWTVSGFTGSSVTITITYPNPVPPGSQYEKLAGGAWVSVPITINGNTITMTIQDNGPDDADPAVGTISDPGGLLVPTTGSYELQIGDSNGACETIGGTFFSGNDTCILATNLNLNSGNSLTIDSGVTLTIAKSGSITNSCNSSCTTTLSGTITNSGTIYNEGTIDYNTITNNGASNINNHGNITSVSYFSNLYNYGAITNNADGAITNNQGTVLYNFASGTIDNYGLITDSVADSVTIYNYNVINNNHGATIGNYFHFVNQPGATITNDGVIIIYGGALYQQGTINNNADGFIDNLTGCCINNSPGATISGTGAFNSTLEAITNSGTITDPVVLFNDNPPTYTINYPVIVPMGVTLTINSGNVLTINSGETISNYGSITIDNSATVNNSGTIKEYCGATFTNTGSLVGNPVTNVCLNPTTIIISPTPSIVTIDSPITFTATVTDTSNSPTNPTGSVSFGVNPNVGGGFGPETCNPVGNNELVCSVTYIAPTIFVTFTPTASYPGDSTHSLSSVSSSPVTTTVPTLTQSSATGQGSVTFTTSSGGFPSPITAISQSSLSTPPPTGSYPFGFFSWTISGLAVGGSTNVCMTYPSDPGTVYEKLIGSTWYQIPVTETTNPDGTVTACMTLTDGAPGQDSDQTANGQITDPGAMAVIAPQQLTQMLINNINAMKIDHGITTSLDSKLNAVISSLASGHDNAAKNQLNAFINEVNAQTGKMITPTQANNMVSSANIIIKLIH